MRFTARSVGTAADASIQNTLRVLENVQTVRDMIDIGLWSGTKISSSNTWSGMMTILRAVAGLI
jgi:hypothetical protein